MLWLDFLPEWRTWKRSVFGGTVWNHHAGVVVARARDLGLVLQGLIRLNQDQQNKTNKPGTRFLEAQLKFTCQFVLEYQVDSLPKCLHCKVENQTNDPVFSSFELRQFVTFLFIFHCNNPQAVGLTSCEGMQEETISDQDGSYRLRGLQVITKQKLFNILFGMKVWYYMDSVTFRVYGQVQL